MPAARERLLTRQFLTVTSAGALYFIALGMVIPIIPQFVEDELGGDTLRVGIAVGAFAVGAVLYALAPFAGRVGSVILFVMLFCLILTMYGGGFATIPAYLADIFGTQFVGAIHGRLLTAWSAAGVVGPLIVNGFLDAAGEPGKLVAADYRPALLTMVGILAIGFVSNLLIRPVPEEKFDQEAARAVHEPATATQGGTR